MAGPRHAPKRLSIDRDLAARLGVIMALAGAAQLVLLGVSIRARFSALELEATAADLGRIGAAVDAEKASLLELTRDYSGWDDTRDFVLGLKPSFPADNFNPDWMAVASLDRVILLAPDATVLWAMARDASGYRALSPEGPEPDGLRPGSPLARLLAGPRDEARVGYGPSPLGLILECAYPVTDSSFAGPPTGWILFARRVDDAMLARVAGRTGLAVTMAGPEAATGGRDIAAGGYAGAWNDEGAQRSLAVALPDADGQALAAFVATRPRSLDRPALRLMMDMLALIAVSAAATAVALLSMARRRVVRPLVAMARRLEARSLAEDGPELGMGEASGREDEIGIVSDRIDDLFRNLSAGRAELKAANDELSRLAALDFVTGLANRRHFDEAARRELRRLQREARGSRCAGQLSVIMGDVDHFKLYNDRYGHQEGDRCLARVADALSGCARRPADLACRYGGEEFIVLLPETDLEGAATLAERMRQAVEALAIPHASSPISDRVTMSLGAACCGSEADAPDAADMLERLIARADAAMYRAKDAGRNRVRLSD